MSEMSDTSLIQITREGPVTILTLNRAETMNPLGAPGDGDEFVRVANAINRDMECRVVILTGAGRAFSAGGDVKAMQNKTGTFGGTAPAISDGYRDNIHLMLRALYGIRVPVIAAVNGAAIGLGCDVACLADIRIASEAAKFGVTFLKLGIIPGDGGTWILPRVIGMSRAAELFYTGDVIDAATAKDWGLVSRVVAADALLDEARALAAKIALLPPHALRHTKNLLRQGQQISYDQRAGNGGEHAGDDAHHRRSCRGGRRADRETRGGVYGRIGAGLTPASETPPPGCPPATGAASFRPATAPCPLPAAPRRR